MPGAAIALSLVLSLDQGSMSGRIDGASGVRSTRLRYHRPDEANGSSND